MILFFKDDKKSTFRSKLVREERDQVIERVAISAVSPGKYSGLEDTKKVKIAQDSVLIESLEAGATLVYWDKGKFRDLLTSE